MTKQEEDVEIKQQKEKEEELKNLKKIGNARNRAKMEDGN